MRADFTSAKKVLRTSNAKINVVAVNGCCYGRSGATDKGEYFKYCGEKFWTFISGVSNLYLDLIEPISHNAREKNEEYVLSYAKMINLFTKEFSNEFCFDNGEIDWIKIVKFNSAIEKL